MQRPSEVEIKEAVEVSKKYAVKVTRTKDDKNKDGEAPIARYFGFLPEVYLEDVIGKRLVNGTDVSSEANIFWEDLVASDRVVKRPHVAIVRKNSLPEQGELWERCTDLHRMPVPPFFKMRIGNVIWDNHIMATTADNLEFETTRMEQQDEEHQAQFVSKLPRNVREGLHITVGTKDATVSPFEARALVEGWCQGTLADD